MSFAANHNHANVKEMATGHNPAGGSSHVTPERCTKTSGRKSSSPEQSSIKMSTTGICSQTATTHTGKSSSAFPSPFSLSPTSPQPIAKVPVKSVHKSFNNQHGPTLNSQTEAEMSHKTGEIMSDICSSNNQAGYETISKTGIHVADDSSSDTQAESESFSKTRIQASSNSQAESESFSKTRIQASSNSQAESESFSKTRIQASSNSQAESESFSKTGIQAADYSSSNSQAESESVSKTGIQVADYSSSHTQAESESFCKTGLQMSDDSSNSDFEILNIKTMDSSSPPTPTDGSSGPHQPSSLLSSKLSRIRQNNLASKKRDQMKTRAGRKLPELAENSELDVLTLHSTTANTNGSHTLVVEGTTNKMPQIPVTDENTGVPSNLLDNPVTPSMPDSFLKKLNIAASNGSNSENFSLDLLPEKEIESKFISLSLAFKTDKLTLDQRVIVQERSRDLAERNVDTELQGLRDAAETLNELVTDKQTRGVLLKIKQHIGALEQLAARVSSRAEVYGAVQQERRMCKAIEVMVIYTENLRRVREKEESELQEARKLLSEKPGAGFSHDSESGPSRRSMSVCGFTPSGRPMRRRSEVTLPRIIGGAGSPPLNPTSNLEQVLSLSKRLPNSAISLESEEREDPKSRFQSAVASTTMQQAVATTLRRCSMERQRSISMSSVPPQLVPASSASSVLQTTSSSTLSVKSESTADKLSEIQGEKQETGSKSSQEEEAFRKGFEEGLKAKLSQELSDLRNQQNSISQSLDQVMDKVDKSQMEDIEYISSPSWFETTMALTSKIRDHILLYDWRSNKTAIRNLTGLVFLLLAFVVVCLCPPISSVGIGRFAKPAR